MNKAKFFPLLSFLIFLVFNTNYSFAQTTDAGKVFSKIEADRLFCPVNYLDKIPVSVLESLLGKCGDIMMFSKGQSTSTSIESRESVMSVTDGDYTMEKSIVCPPDCPTDPLP